MYIPPFTVSAEAINQIVEKQLKKFKDLGIITRQGSDKTG